MVQKDLKGSPSREPEPKRRKIRKGTQSCWECKRRKIRCIFTAPSDAVCDGCRRRGTTCISQEFQDEPSRAGQVVDRLGRIEAMVERLTRKVDHHTEILSSSSSALNLRKGPDLSEGLQTSTPTVNTPKEVPKYHDLSSQLVAAWPSQRDLNLILSLPSSVLDVLQNFTCTLYSAPPDQNTSSPRDILQLPPPGSHPVLIARKLLLLGSFLQGIRPSYQHIDGLSLSFRDTLMFRMIETAHNQVTHDDDLVDSIEGIECLLTESLYYNYSGNLRHSWRTVRRAMLLAQLMGLHRDSQSLGQVKVLEPSTRARTDPPRIWFRLVQMDRYLSLMFGLPLNFFDDSFADPKVLEGCVDMERMQRIQCVATGRILQRDQAGIDDPTVTNEIDTLLYEASCAMPPRWWLPPSAGDNTKSLDEIVRVMNLLVHHHLLVRLHLPYLLRFSADRKYDYSKITAVNASREVLSHFVSFRASNPATPYCSGVDFLVFISGTVLCIAHIEGRRQRQMYGPGLGDTRGDVFFNSLVHRRLADRGLMERAVEGMAVMASVLRRLLEIEACAAAGMTYCTYSSREDSTGVMEGFECKGDLDDGGNVLSIHIPYFGSIKIERGDDSTSGLSIPEASGLGPVVSFDNPVHPEYRGGERQQSQHPVDTPASCQVEDYPVVPGWQAMSAHFDPVVPSEQLSSINKHVGVLNSPTTNDRQLFTSELPTRSDGWTLQGVDMAFLDGFLRRASEEYLPL